MANVDVAEIERVHVFERKVKAYQESRKTLSAKFHRAVEIVGATWKDADYRKIVQLSEVVERQLQAAGRVVDEHLVPFLARKRAVIDEKGRSPSALPR